MKKNRSVEVKVLANTTHKTQILFAIAMGVVVLLALYTGVKISSANEKQNEVEVTDGGIQKHEIVSGMRGQVDMASGPQYIVFAFDGSRSLAMWEDTRKFARDMNASGVPFHFTYFINPIYLLTKEEAKNMYQPPRASRGASNIGYADSAYDANQRIQEILLASNEGNEIASHAVGHFDGTTWNIDEWRSELTQFDSILASKGIDRKSLIRGFRAPELGQNDALYPVLQELGYKYDTSKVALAQDTPWKMGTMWELPVASIDYAPNNTPGLSMDFSIYMHQTQAEERAKKGSLEWQALYDDTLTTYRNYFKQNYEGNHAPMYIAHHFSPWNDGVYYAVMKDFAKEVCVKKNVRCVTYREMVRELNQTK